MRKAFSVALYCRHEGAVLLIKHRRLGLWLPPGGEIEPGESPMEAARRELVEETGYAAVSFPHIHSVVGAPPGLLLYEEHEAGSKGLHMNFAFLVEVPFRIVSPQSEEYDGLMWVHSVPEVPRSNCPLNVLDTLPFALTAGR